MYFVHVPAFIYILLTGMGHRFPRAKRFVRRYTVFSAMGTDTEILMTQGGSHGIEDLGRALTRALLTTTYSGSDTLTSCLPMLPPFSMPINAAAVFSNPSVIVSLYFSLPS